MNPKYSTEEERRRWIEAQKKATETWISGDMNGALELVSQYLAGVQLSDQRRQAIAFRGDLYEDAGDLEAAKNDFGLAHDLSEAPDYERYTLEIALGSVAKKMGDLEAAESWYLKALETAAVDLTTSGGTALRCLLKLRGGLSLSDDERSLVEKVVRQSWHLLRVEGEPDLVDLEGTAGKLIAAQSRPLSEESTS